MLIQVHFWCPGLTLIYYSIPRSPNAFTYLFTPESTLRSLFASFNMEYKGVPPFNASQTLKLNDTLPSGSNASDIALGGTPGDPHFYISSDGIFSRCLL